MQNEAILSLEQLLHENMLLISAIHECRTVGMQEQAAQYQLRLHRNLLTISQRAEHKRTQAARAQVEAEKVRPWSAEEEELLDAAVRVHGVMATVALTRALGGGRTEVEVAHKVFEGTRSKRWE